VKFFLNKKIQALSLIETTIYLALFSLIFTTIVQFSLSVAESNQNADYRNELERTAIFLDENFSRGFLNSSELLSDNSTFYNDSGKLYLSGSNGTLIYTLSSSFIKLNRNGDINNLNNPMTVISKFYLEKVLAPDLSIAGVRVTINLQSQKKSSITKTFQSYYSIK
jgi:hypothetical protein